MKKVNAHQIELGLEVIVEMRGGVTIEGKIMDYTMSRVHVWVETKEDTYQINTEVDHVFEASAMHVPADMVASYQAVLEEEEERAPEGLLTLKELKEAIADELKGQWYEEIESVKVAIYNSDEDGAEVYDCEVQIVLDNGDSIYPTFGTFYNEQDALKHARDMRTKLKRTYDISDKVAVYTC